MRILKLFAPSFAPPLRFGPRGVFGAPEADGGASLRAAWPQAPQARAHMLPRPEPLPLPSRFGPSKQAQVSRKNFPQPAGPLNLTFAHSPARARRIKQGLMQAGIVSRLDGPLVRLPTYSILRGQLSRAQALSGKHLLSQHEWAQVWVALNVYHHGLKATPTRITRMPMDMRYDYFAVVGLTNRPEVSRQWVAALRDAGVLSRRLHPKSFAAVPAAARALGLTADTDLLGRMVDSLFVLPDYSPKML